MAAAASNDSPARTLPTPTAAPFKKSRREIGQRIPSSRSLFSSLIEWKTFVTAQSPRIIALRQFLCEQAARA
jgi:hypothetical protein